MNVFDFRGISYRRDRHSLSPPIGFVVRYMGKLVGGLYSGHQNDSHRLEASQSTSLSGAFNASSFGSCSTCTYSSLPN